MRREKDISELVRRIGEGDQLSESEFVANYRQRVFAIAASRAKVMEDAHEITNETLRICITNIQKGKLEHPEKLVNYILGVLRRQIAKYYRGLYAKKRSENVVRDSLDNESVIRMIERRISRMKEPEDPLERILDREKRRGVRQAVEKVRNKRQRQVLTYLLHGFSQGEIADKLNISLKQLYSLSYRARGALGKVLNDMAKNGFGI